MEDRRVRWYVVSTQSGQELNVKQNIDTRINTMNMQEYILQTLVVEEEVPVLKKGEPTGKTKMKNVYPRYLFVKMIMSDEAWFVIRNTPGVTGFVGSSGKGTKPIPVPKEEMDRVLKMVGIFDEELYSKYKAGDTVRVLRGIYQDQKGIIKYVDKDTNQLEVEVTMMGRKATGRFPFTDVEAI